jgi:3-hydroxyacyl-CoA dehydrogenase
MVAAGRFGIKSGEGFYTYAGGNKESIVSNKFQKVL